MISIYSTLRIFVSSAMLMSFVSLMQCGIAEQSTSTRVDHHSSALDIDVGFFMNKKAALLPHWQRSFKSTTIALKGLILDTQYFPERLISISIYLNGACISGPRLYYKIGKEVVDINWKQTITYNPHREQLISIDIYRGRAPISTAHLETTLDQIMSFDTPTGGTVHHYKNIPVGSLEILNMNAPYLFQRVLPLFQSLYCVFSLIVLFNAFFELRVDNTTLNVFSLSSINQCPGSSLTEFRMRQPGPCQSEKNQRSIS